MTVAQNMAFALRMAKVPKAEQDRSVREAARSLGSMNCSSASPACFPVASGSAWRWAARSCGNPRCSAWTNPCPTSISVRVRTRTEIAKPQRDLGVTTAYVTHDQVEAVTMGERVAVMKLGVIQQVDVPLKLYDKPANLFVDQILGSPQMNLIEGVADNGRVTIGVRPESWRIVRAADGGIPVEINIIEELGADGFAYGTSQIGGVPHNFIVRMTGRSSIGKGATIHVTTSPPQMRVFDTKTGAVSA